ncbi:MAG: hypothetical protein ACRDTA_10265 [Pseudonocardiaceae bacterium]
MLAAGWTAQLEDLLPLVAPGLRPTSVVHRRDLGAVTTAVTAQLARAMRFGRRASLILSGGCCSL